jgi:putative transposase
MFTVRRLGASDTLARSLCCTNAVESTISVVATLCDRVTNWKDHKMVRRWVGVGMLEAQRSFRRIKGCKDMPALVKAVRAEVARRRAPQATPKATATTKTQCAVA